MKNTRGRRCCICSAEIPGGRITGARKPCSEGMCKGGRVLPGGDRVGNQPQNPRPKRAYFAQHIICAEFAVSGFWLFGFRLFEFELVGIAVNCLTASGHSVACTTS